MSKGIAIAMILALGWSMPSNSDSTQKIRTLAWFTKVPKVGSQNQMVKYFDFFVLTKSDEPYRDELKAKGVSSSFVQYLLFTGIQRPEHGKKPHRNQVADQEGDFERIKKNHPDWFLYDKNGNAMDDGDGYFMMDPAHPGWQKFWLDRARQSQEQLGWDGVFLDNVEASLIKRRRMNQVPAKYETEQSYLNAIESFLSFMSSNYFRPKGKLLYANIITLKNTNIWFRYLKYLDGAMTENFAVDWHDYRSAEEWMENLQWAEETQKIGKQIILVSQGNQNDQFRQQFAFASYLLIANGSAMFRYAHQNHYREVWIYPNYDLDLGSSKGNRYKSAGGNWCRDFTRGRVCANPVTHRSEIMRS